MPPGIARITETQELGQVAASQKAKTPAGRWRYRVRDAILPPTYSMICPTVCQEAVKKPSEFQSCNIRRLPYARGISAENITSKQPLIRYVNRQQMSWR